MSNEKLRFGGCGCEAEIGSDDCCPAATTTRLTAENERLKALPHEAEAGGAMVEAAADHLATRQNADRLEGLVEELRAEKARQAAKLQTSKFALQDQIEWWRMVGNWVRSGHVEIAALRSAVDSAIRNARAALAEPGEEVGGGK